MANCAYCGKHFKSKNNKQIFCSRGCANKDKAKWKKPSTGRGKMEVSENG